MQDIQVLKAGFIKIEQMASGHLYFVGGIVRDLLMRRQTRDIDLAYDGNIDALHEVLCQHFKIQKSKFSTLSLSIDKYNIDIAKIRKDTYPNQDGFAMISEASVEEDILRRDFTVNTGYMLFNALNIEAICRFLSSERPSEFEIAYAHPHFLRDLNNRVVSVLHDKSFEEDPSRLLRCLKYCVSHGFKLDKYTKHLFIEAVEGSYIDKLSISRFTLTFDRVIMQPKWNEIVNLGFETHLLQSFLHLEYQKINLSSANFWAQNIQDRDMLKYRYMIVFKGQASYFEPVHGKVLQTFSELLKNYKNLVDSEGSDDFSIKLYMFCNEISRQKYIIQCALGYVIDSENEKMKWLYNRLFEHHFSETLGIVFMYEETIATDALLRLKRCLGEECLKVAYFENRILSDLEVASILKTHQKGYA